MDLVKSGRVINGNQLMCSNSTLVIDLGNTYAPYCKYVVISDNTPGRTLPPSSVVVTPSSVVVTPSSVVVTPSTVVVTLTSSSVTPTLLQPTPTATVVPKTCRRLDNSPSLYGFLDWPQTSIDQSVSLECPNGPDGGVASRECGERGEWETIDGTECTAASETTQMLIMIVEVSLKLYILYNNQCMYITIPFRLKLLHQILRMCLPHYPLLYQRHQMMNHSP